MRSDNGSTRAGVTSSLVSLQDNAVHGHRGQEQPNSLSGYLIFADLHAYARS